jgi:hypothetical protein
MSNNDASLAIRDAAGNLVSETEVSAIQPQDVLGLNYAVRHGHLFVAVLENSLLAIDMFRGAADGEESLLWNDWFAQVAANQRVRTPGERTNYNPFDQLYPSEYFVADGTNKPVGTLGPVHTHGVVFLKSRELVCVDPLSGETLWSRRDIEPGSELFGDREYIFVAPYRGRSAMVLSALDGSIVGMRTIPPDRWKTDGRLILAWERQGDSSRLRVYDAWEERDLWSESYSRDSRGFLSDSSLAVLEPSGRLQIREWTREIVEVEARLEPEESLRAVYLLSSADQHLLVTDRNAAARGVQPIGGGNSVPLISGRVYAFERSSGKALWQSPAEIEDFGLPLHQPRAAPTLWFLRQQSAVQPARPPIRSSRTIAASILCLDRRDGRTLFAREDVPISQGPFAIEANQAAQSVQLELSTVTVSLEFTGDDVPPEPPMQSELVLSQAEAAGTR